MTSVDKVTDVLKTLLNVPQSQGTLSQAAERDVSLGNRHGLHRRSSRRKLGSPSVETDTEISGSARKVVPCRATLGDLFNKEL